MSGNKYSFIILNEITVNQFINQNKHIYKTNYEIGYFIPLTMCGIGTILENGKFPILHQQKSKFVLLLLEIPRNKSCMF